MDDSSHSECGEGVETAVLSLGPWECCAQAPGLVTQPMQLAENGDWLSAAVPGTVASALNAAGRWDYRRPEDIDGQDWWYRTTFKVPDDLIGQPCVLCFDGLATLADIWLNGERLLSTDNMFRAYELDVTSLLNGSNELAICFRSLAADLQQKRPRPRWKTNLVDHQQLRWRRTTLLGRIPGWSPPVPAIGPWRRIRIERQPVRLNDVRLVAALDGTTGVVTLRARLEPTAAVERVTLRVGSQEIPLTVRDADDRKPVGALTLHGELRIANVPVWWPHTHGEQPLFDCQVIVESVCGRHVIDCGQVGFRNLQVDTTNRGFSVSVNGEPIYCRGACWTVSDIFTLDGTKESLDRDLRLARDAGANMLRVGGTMTYESDLFYRLCDELGILVWQDFMFANMDYPEADEAFSASIAAEATGQLQRLSPHPCVAIYCGNSEIEQQAAMLGMPRELWRNDWFAERLPALCAALHPTTAYVPSTPSGGVLPFQADSGVCHYYGVGAYLRSPSELRQVNVRFTPECLGFANVPEPDIVNEIMEGTTAVTHHPKWKQRIPRDTGAGWDFEDVRDHYLQHLFGLAAVPLRSHDMRRYWQLSRVASGEMMALTYSEWRSGHSHNQGALVWFFKDLWPAAGWGVIDSTGSPKAAFYALKRLWRNRQITLTDEGLNGLHLHLINETTEPLDGFVEVTLLKEPSTVVARREVAVQLSGRSRRTLAADEIVGGFYDISYAYRFGPPHHDIVIATLLDADRNVISEAFHFIRRRDPVVVPTANIETLAEMTSETTCAVTLSCDRFLHAVQLGAKGFIPDDNYFHLAPGRKKIVTFVATRKPSRGFRADVEALNIDSSHTITPRKEPT